MKCYVNNPRANAEMPRELNKENTLFYPEASMTFEQQHRTGVPRDFNIMTDSPLLVALYKNRTLDGNITNCMGSKI